MGSSGLGPLDGRYRLYTEADVARMPVIRRMKPLGFTLAEMKQLVDSIDILDDETAGPALRRAAQQDLLALRDKAADNAGRLRRQLAYAEEFTGLLSARPSD
ncbi:MerR family transcriptional regulator [Gordonia neofelifaecis]|uniref:MerR family transcriptional regulator n=1 Tax=Gordonia neofelifaecis NRRL B-59395 TaxID=644548 RepID=F1YPU1_9ACTN|nr:MerR family transcriptional regulator [Gordonia neofelifaecis NRRL B-59395]